MAWYFFLAGTILANWDIDVCWEDVLQLGYVANVAILVGILEAKICAEKDGSALGLSRLIPPTAKTQIKRAPPTQH
jgi:hypothetical protein